VDQVLGLCQEVTDQVMSWFVEEDDEKKEELQLALKQSLPKTFIKFESMLKENGGNGYFVGPTMTLADIAAWKVVGWLINEANFPEALGGYPYLSPVPKLTAHFRSIEKLPKIVQYIRSKGSSYDLHAYD